jgi:hypothetical protein
VRQTPGCAGRDTERASAVGSSDVNTMAAADARQNHDTNMVCWVVQMRDT